jgi:hypothetical protein
MDAAHKKKLAEQKKAEEAARAKLLAGKKK